MKTISSMQIISQVINNFGLKNVPVADLIEYVYDAIEAIGRHMLPTVTKIIENASVENHLITKPVDCIGKIVIYYNDKIVNENVSSNNLRWINNNDTIWFSLQDSTVKLEYAAAALDEDGYPSILDTFKYREAVRYFLMMKLMEQGVVHPVLDYETVSSNFTKYKLKASNDWIVPTSYYEEQRGISEQFVERHSNLNYYRDDTGFH